MRMSLNWTSTKFHYPFACFARNPLIETLSKTMTTNRFSELGSETGENSFLGRRLETLDDIPREIADRRLHAEFGEFIAPEKSEIVRETSDIIEKPEEFAESAKAAGLEDPEGVLGYSTKLEDPAHVLKGDVGSEIATLIHEDLHRYTSPETLREIQSDPELRDIYEGVTERFTEQAAEGLHGFEPGKIYPEQVEAARHLASEVGDQALRDWYFRHEVAEDLQKALDRMGG